MSRYKGYTEKCKEYSRRYKNKCRENLGFDLPKGKKALYKAYAKSKGVSLTVLFTNWIESEIKNDNFVYSDVESTEIVEKN